MKFLILLVAVAIVVAKPYDSKYSEMNVNEIVENTKLLGGFGKCFVGEAKCTPEGKDLKDMIPGAVQNQCAECTDIDKQKIATFITALKEKFPEIFEKLMEMHDPQGMNRGKLDDFLKEYKP